MTIILGTRASATFYGCSSHIFDNEDRISDLFVSVLQTSGFHVVNKLAYTFNPYGITCMIVLSESHAILHTWPEYSVIIVDVFVCDNGSQIQKLFKLLGSEIKSLRIEMSSDEVQLEV